MYIYLYIVAVDRCISSSMSDAREAIVNAAIDILNSYGSSLTSGQRSGSLCINEQLKLIPLYCLALLKSVSRHTSFVFLIILTSVGLGFE